MVNMRGLAYLSVNLWRLDNGRWVRRWDHPGLIDSQERQGPATREMSAVLQRLDQEYYGSVRQRTVSANRKVNRRG